ncbi:manganese-dependent inorganic pyrophosphatase [Desulfofustis limnaeus]|jgi:manganese-dependent inorganic pyrophosphatase|uniref:inorganic diphosphatase n=1 Tax=Desulfofustis limnaeus TaxID=2740163 RepID=A0ABN6M337_9BACT|nr:manganese-dependent inorganic pyrophosphatase [Desulfofustis limnaeus]MDX9894202.1 manganese-dependent inorganic pyrophosphatase [Desulfofustis sp.]BDD87286.1 manganese-dependent inorganic pyrophosphatase [Desulfofustis limnaeus]
MTICVVGHSSPDTDSVTSAIAYAALLKAQGKDAKACMQCSPDGLNPESKLVVERFGLSMPEQISDAAGKQLALVDFSDLAQGPANLAQAEVVAIVDHHKIGDVTTNNPILFRAEPVGCTGTVLNKMFKDAGVAIPKNVAGGMLAAILSDTVNFKSPTCTADDKAAVAELKGVAGVSDTDALFMDMLKAKSAVAGVPPRDLLFRDFKDFDMKGSKVGVGQLELATIDQVADVRADLLKAMQAVKEEGRHSVLLMLTDVVKEGTDLVVLSDDPALIEKAFGGTLQNNSMWIDGMMSRKKQTIPNLQKAFGC